jgi:hypothetical protein
MRTRGSRRLLSDPRRPAERRSSGAAGAQARAPTHRPIHHVASPWGAIQSSVEIRAVVGQPYRKRACQARVGGSGVGPPGGIKPAASSAVLSADCPFSFSLLYSV